MQHTASFGALIRQCAYPFTPGAVLSAPTDSSQARYGRRFHVAMDALLRRRAPPGVYDAQAREHVLRSYRLLRDYLDAHWKGAEPHSEYPMALNAGAHSARKCAPHNEAHVYEDALPGEIPGTADLVAVPKDPSLPLLMLDHKTGWYGAKYAAPESLEQLEILGLAACLHFGRSSYVPAILHARKGSPAYIYAGPRVEATVTMTALWAARLVANAAPRTGPECGFCRARAACPAQTSAFGKSSGAV